MTSMLSAEQAYALLRKYRIKAVNTGLAKTFPEAELLAENIGFPLILKIDAAQIVHKTDVGCVRIAYSQDKLGEVYKEVTSNARKITKEINGVLVQEFVRGLEAITGSAMDGQFGKVMMFGSGGVLTQIFKDVSFRLVPISKEDAESMIDDTKVSQLLNYRGSNIDKNKIVDVLLKLNNLVQNENIHEMDINPLFLNDNGAFAADVRVVKA